MKITLCLAFIASAFASRVAYGNGGLPPNDPNQTGNISGQFDQPPPIRRKNTGRSRSSGRVNEGRRVRLAPPPTSWVPRARGPRRVQFAAGTRGGGQTRGNEFQEARPGDQIPPPANLNNMFNLYQDNLDYY
jgi:hypothetical protein